MPLVTMLFVALLYPTLSHGEDQAKTPLGLQLVAEGIHDASLKQIDGNGYEIVTTGTDPYVFTNAMDATPDLSTYSVLAFECFTVTPTRSVKVYFTPPAAEEWSITGRGLGHSEGWVAYSLDLSTDPHAWSRNWKKLRIDFGDRAGCTIRIRNIVLREPTEREQELAASGNVHKAAEEKLDRDLRAYLDAEYPCTISDVSVTEEFVTVTGQLAGETGEIYLCESPLYQHLTELGAFDRVEPIGGTGEFCLKLDRYLPLGDRRYDRLFSRWVVARKTDAGYALLSHGRYADAVVPQHELPEATPRSKKGLGGFVVGWNLPVSDLDDLGITSVTVNIQLDFMRAGPGEGRIAFDYDGKTYYADEHAIDRLDRTLQETARRDIVVSAIILVPKADAFENDALGRTFQHPDCDPSAIYTMANLTTPEGLEYYAAALDFLARRYMRPDEKYGRIHHWIVHNEVDAGWVWTNAGDKTPLIYMDLYHKSMRVSHLIGRKYDAHVHTFISLTHAWTEAEDPRFYHSSELLDILLDFSKAEGDFEWAVALHPYPQSLYNPRTWEDTKVDFTLETPFITFKNIEVLAAWARQPRTFFKGRDMRVIFLSEQGLNATDYSEDALLAQAAGMAYAWKKIEVLPEIQAFQYHGWVDIRGEGGLRLGLRKFYDAEGDPFGDKPIWHLYRALGTPEEDAACAFALKYIGLENWDEVRYQGEIE